MLKYGNQKVITVKKPATYNENFTLCSQEAMFEAMRELCETKAGFALWMYLIKNQPNHHTALSSKDFMNVSGYKIKAYNAAVEALIEKGYLVDCGNNSYIFYEKRLMPREDKEPKKTDVDVREGDLSSESTSTYAPREQDLSSGSTRNNINNITNNINNILAAEPQKITREELETTYIDREWRIQGNEVIFYDSDETFILVEPQRSCDEEKKESSGYITLTKEQMNSLVYGADYIMKDGLVVMRDGTKYRFPRQ